jgi:hypothetical protein
VGCVLTYLGEVMNIIELAKQADLDWARGWTLEDDEPNRFETFAALVEAAARADEREECAELMFRLDLYGEEGKAAEAIRARGTT